MKNHIILFTFFIALTIVVSSCKKSSSVVGNWTLIGLSGTSTSINFNSGGNDTTTITYTFAGGSVTITSNGTSYHDVPLNTYMTYTLGIDIESGGSLDMTEKGLTTNNTAFNDTYNGTWNYVSNSTNNNGIQFNLPVGGGYGTPILYSQFVTNGTTGSPFNGTFVVSSVSSSQLVLTYSEQTTQLVGNNSNSTLTLTFSK